MCWLTGVISSGWDEDNICSGSNIAMVNTAKNCNSLGGGGGLFKAGASGDWGVMITLLVSY